MVDIILRLGSDGKVVMLIAPLECKESNLTSSVLCKPLLGLCSSVGVHNFFNPLYNTLALLSEGSLTAGLVSD